MRDAGHSYKVRVGGAVDPEVTLFVLLAILIIQYLPVLK